LGEEGENKWYYKLYFEGFIPVWRPGYRIAVVENLFILIIKTLIFGKFSLKEPSSI
jgi:hypothetical protein